MSIAFAPTFAVTPMSTPTDPLPTGTDGPTPGRVFQPTSVAEVVSIVQQARRTGRPVFPISTGMNWGYRSESPTARGHDVVDLRKMNRILNADQISEANPIALIEPGVTQGQLHEFLESRVPGLTFNVTGSAVATSIIGNSLDRGVGYFGPRREDLFGLEVVTGTGEILRTGFRRLGDDSPLAHCHPYGLGPELDGLFFQGNFGIVTSACFRLTVKAPCRLGVTLSLRHERDLPLFLDRLAELKRSGVMGSVTHVGNRARTHSTLAPGLEQFLAERCSLSGAALAADVQAALALVAPTEWSAVGAVSGTRLLVKASIAEIRRALKGIARVTVVSDSKLGRLAALAFSLKFVPTARRLAAALTAVQPLHGLALGIPTDAAVAGLLWRYNGMKLPAEQFDQSSCGLIYVCPALPLDGRFIVRVIEEMTAVARQWNHVLYVTANFETGTSAVAVTNLLYDKSVPAEAARAESCAAALHHLIQQLKLEVYRARDEMMPTVLARNPGHWRQVDRLRTSLDPEHVIAPGHYSTP